MSKTTDYPCVTSVIASLALLPACLLVNELEKMVYIYSLCLPSSLAEKEN